MVKYSEDKALTKMASYCSKAERCEFDVRRKLQACEIEERVITKIIERLINEKFLDEERYCRSFIKDKSLFNKWGRNKIIFELKKKHISEKVINLCFDDADPNLYEQQLLKLLESKKKNIKASNDYDKNIKLIRFALGRGYTMDQVKKCLSQLQKDDNDEYL